MSTTTDTKPAKIPVPALVIEDTDAPVSYVRRERENPFADKVRAMAAEWDEATGRSRRSAKVTVPATEVGKYSRLLRDAVKGIGRGIRLNVENLDDGASAVIHFQVAVLKVGAGRPKGSTKSSAKASAKAK